MELIQLNYFKTVARTGKISAAAQELFLSPPALSTSISRLEKELGTQLFDRTGNRIALNTQGKIFLRHVDEIFTCLDRAKNELAHSLLQQKKHIWLATTGSTPWMDLITAFSQENPSVTLTCSTINHGTVEKIFTHYPLLLAEDEAIPDVLVPMLDSIFLFRDQPAVMVHPDHPLAQQERIRLEDLHNEKLFLPIPGMHRRDQLIRLLSCGGIDIDATTSCNYAIYRNMVQQNMGVAFTTTRSNHINLGNLRVIPLENPLTPWNMCLFWRSDHILSPAEELFRTFAQQHYQA